MKAERTFWKITRYVRAVRFWFFLLAGAIAWLGFTDAKAGTYGCPVGAPCDRGAAYARAEQHRVELASSTNPNLNVAVVSLFGTYYELRCSTAACLNTTQGRYYFVACPSNLPWNEATKTCGSGCESKPPLPAGSVRGASGACVDGCAYQQSSATGVDVCLGEGPTMFCAASRWTPTGSTCTVEKPLGDFDPAKPTCVATGGGYSECVEPTGRKCVTGAQGGRYCFDPGQTGPRSNAQGTEGASNTPQGQEPVKPQNMPDATGTQGTTTTINNTTTTTTTWIGSGGTPGQSNTGPGGHDLNGPGTSDGSGEGEGDGPGDVGGGVGDLYEGTDKTLQTVFGDFQARVSQSTLISAGTGIFGGCSGGGSCPSETWTAAAWDISYDLGMLCAGVLASLVAFAGWVALAGMGYFAWKVAFL